MCIFMVRVNVCKKKYNLKQKIEKSQLKIRQNVAKLGGVNKKSFMYHQHVTLLSLFIL